VPYVDSGEAKISYTEQDPEHLPAATEAAGRFLRDHTPR
jgi:hypothetical protein